jgi:hypothetical protein
MITAWVLNLEGRKWLTAEEANFFTRFNSRSDTTQNKSECVKIMAAQFKELFKPWKNGEPKLGDIILQSQMAIEEIELPGEPLSEIAPVRQPHPSTALTRVAQQRTEFSRELEQYFAATINERLSARLDTGAFHIAEHEARQMATALGMDADQITVKLPDWLFTIEIPDASTIPDLHWREVHARHPDWRLCKDWRALYFSCNE